MIILQSVSQDQTAYLEERLEVIGSDLRHLTLLLKVALSLLVLMIALLIIK